MKHSFKISAIAATVAASVLSVAVPIAWAGQGFAPEPPRPTPIVRCAPDVAPAQAVLVPGHGHTYRLYPVRALRLLTPAERGRAVPCVFVTPVRVIR